MSYLDNDMPYLKQESTTVMEPVKPTKKRNKPKMETEHVTKDHSESNRRIFIGFLVFFALMAAVLLFKWVDLKEYGISKEIHVETLDVKEAQHVRCGLNWQILIEAGMEPQEDFFEECYKELNIADNASQDAFSR